MARDRLRDLTRKACPEPSRRVIPSTRRVRGNPEYREIASPSSRNDMQSPWGMSSSRWKSEETTVSYSSLFRKTSRTLRKDSSTAESGVLAAIGLPTWRRETGALPPQLLEELVGPLIILSLSKDQPERITCQAVSMSRHYWQVVVAVPTLLFSFSSDCAFSESTFTHSVCVPGPGAGRFRLLGQPGSGRLTAPTAGAAAQRPGSQTSARG